MAKWGIRLEDDVAEGYADETGLKVELEPNLIRHSKYPFLAANIDRWVDGKKFILECKTSSPWNIAKPGEEGHPDKWGRGLILFQCPNLCQVAFYSAICDVDKVDIAVFFSIDNFKIYSYQCNKELEETLVKIGYNFWDNHVLKRVPPPVVTLKDCSMLYPKSISRSVTADELIQDDIIYLRQLKAEEKAIKDKMDNAQIRIKSFMQDI